MIKKMCAMGMRRGEAKSPFQQKKNGDKRKVEKIIVARHSHIPTTTSSSRTTRSSQEHPTVTRVVHGGIELVLI